MSGQRSNVSSDDYYYFHFNYYEMEKAGLFFVLNILSLSLFSLFCPLGISYNDHNYDREVFVWTVYTTAPEVCPYISTVLIFTTRTVKNKKIQMISHNSHSQCNTNTQIIQFSNMTIFWNNMINTFSNGG